MGKYMKRSKITGDVAVMEVSQTASAGVRTRAAKNLALQRLGSTSAAAPFACDANSSSYLQLRSRRLEKPSVKNEARKSQQKKLNGSSGAGLDKVKRGQHGASGLRWACEDEGGSDNNDKLGGEADGLSGSAVEASVGENSSEFEARDRRSRENTPCNLIRDSEVIATPGSTRRTNSSTNYQTSLIHTQRIAPTANEIEMFFADAEHQQRKWFMEKYNFDVVNDRPLPGRYEWVQVIP